ncbi:MAG: D-aminoacylase, partial [Acidobacteria bacterium]
MFAPRHRTLLMLLAAGVLTLGLAPAPQPEFDLLITGGRLLDGGGNPWVSGSVAVKGDRIARVGRFTATAVRVIDATGLYVSPGFVDIMDQSGPSLRRDGTAQSKVRQGVTTAIGGEGGTPGAPAELDQYFATIERQGISLNFGTFVSAEQARTAVLGAVNREPDAAELERMKAVIEAAMQRGALGMTTA